MRYYNPYKDEIAATGIPIDFDENEEKQSINTAFIGNVQHYWDSTSLSLYKTCPRKYFWTIIEGYVPKTTPPPLAFGIALHTIFQTWHQLIDSLDKHTAFIRVVKLAGLLGQNITTGDTARTKETLIRTTVWYIDQFWNDNATSVKIHEKVAVEQHFVLPLIEHKGETVFITGHIDRLVKWQGYTYCADYKSTKYSLDNRFFQQFKPSVQMGLYVTACKLITNSDSEFPPANGVIIDGIQLGVNFSRFARQIVPYSLEEIDEYIENLQVTIKQAMNACEKKVFPPNETACNNYSGCHFRDICAKPLARREAFLNGNFKRRTWNPLARRS